MRLCSVTDCLHLGCVWVSGAGPNFLAACANCEMKLHAEQNRCQAYVTRACGSLPAHSMCHLPSPTVIVELSTAGSSLFVTTCFKSRRPSCSSSPVKPIVTAGRDAAALRAPAPNTPAPTAAVAAAAAAPGGVERDAYSAGGVDLLLKLPLVAPLREPGPYASGPTGPTGPPKGPPGPLKGPPGPPKGPPGPLEGPLL
jgi:hypothetical protein